MSKRIISTSSGGGDERMDNGELDPERSGELCECEDSSIPWVFADEGSWNAVRSGSGCDELSGSSLKLFRSLERGFS